VVIVPSHWTMLQGGFLAILTMQRNLGRNELHVDAVDAQGDGCLL
jgi:hypothetical protein